MASTLLVQPPFALTLPTLSSTRSYLVDVDTEAYIGAWSYKNRSEIRYQLIREVATSNGQRLAVRSSGFRQINNEGLHRLDANMARLKQTLDLTLASSGQLQSVDNQADILNRFQPVRADWLRRYANDDFITPGVIDGVNTVLATPDQLVRTLSQSMDLGLLLPPIFQQAYTIGSPVAGPTLELPRALATLSLPLTTTITRRPPTYPDVALDLVVTGQLDMKRFAFDEARTLLQQMTGVVEIDPTPDVQYIDTFEFDKTHQLLYAGRFVTVIFPEIAMSKTVVTISPVQ